MQQYYCQMSITTDTSLTVTSRSKMQKQQSMRAQGYCTTVPQKSLLHLQNAITVVSEVKYIFCSLTQQNSTTVRKKSKIKNTT